MKRNRLVTLLTTIFFTAATISPTIHAMSMNELFDEVNAMGNVSNPAVLQGQTMNMYTGGSLFMRMPNKTYNLASVNLPNWSAGCGGIDLFMGGFGFINKDQFVAMLRNIGSNAIGYGFKLAMQNLCPTCDNVMQALQATANQINRLNIDSCESAVGIVNATTPETWTRGRQQTARHWGVDTNIFENITDAWTNVMNDANRANQATEDAANANPNLKDSKPSGNIVWKALKKIDGMDDEHRMLLMSMIGTVVFNPNENVPRYYPRTNINVQQLVGAQDLSVDLKLPIWRCDTTGIDGCLNPQRGVSAENTKSFRHMVNAKLGMIADRIATRSAHDSVDEVLQFLNVTDLPVYKMVSVATSLDNTAMADALIGRYQDLIAAKYAEVYIQEAVKDLRTAISYFEKGTTHTAAANVLTELRAALDTLLRDAKLALSVAYSQTISTYNISLEILHLERAVNANMSQTLRNSLAFGKSLR